MLKVSQNTQTNKLATSIGFVCEHGEAPLILALGPANVNTAVKAMAIARRKLKEENVDLRLYPTFREGAAKRFSAILLQTWKEEGNGNMQMEDEETDAGLNRKPFLDALGRYFDVRGLSADWETLKDADDELLINSLSMMLDFDAEDKQALLEAPSLSTRRETLMTLIEYALRGGSEGEMMQ